MNARLRTWALLLTIIALGVGLLFTLLVGLAMQRGPAGRIVLAAGGSDGAYLELAKTWQDDLRRNGVTLELRDDLQASDLLTVLRDPKSGIDGGVVKGGFNGSLTGRLATARARDRHGENNLATRSLGRLLMEPIWVFTRGDLPIRTLRDLQGRKIMTGTSESGTRRVAQLLLRANGVNRDNSLLIDRSLEEDAKALLSGEADAAILILPPESDRIQRLLRVDNIRLMDFSPEANAYTSRFPALSKVVMHRAAVEFEPLIPSADITLLATEASLIVKRDMHPSLIALLTHAVLHNPKSPIDRLGEPVLFHKAGQFPHGDDPEYEVAPDARQVYKSGEPPLLLRIFAPLNARFRLPFALTSFANSYGAHLLLLLIPALTIMLPLMRAVPFLYRWVIRQRLLRRYAELKRLETHMEGSAVGQALASLSAEVDRIDAAARRIRVPLEYTDQLYELRAHIDLVRRQLDARARTDGARAAA
jgi:hypothetical protein